MSSEYGSRENVRALRKTATEAEKLLWQRLRSGKLAGYKFRRQHSFPPYIVDFVCLSRKLVIELDGGQHAIQPERDEKRTSFLDSLGYRVIRFWNNDVLGNTEGVLMEIERKLKAQDLFPSHYQGEGQGGGGKVSGGGKVCRGGKVRGGRSGAQGISVSSIS